MTTENEMTQTDWTIFWCVAAAIASFLIGMGYAAGYYHQSTQDKAAVLVYPFELTREVVRQNITIGTGLHAAIMRCDQYDGTVNWSQGILWCYVIEGPDAGEYRMEGDTWKKVDIDTL